MYAAKSNAFHWDSDTTVLHKVCACSCLRGKRSHGKAADSYISNARGNTHWQLYQKSNEEDIPLLSTQLIQNALMHGSKYIVTGGVG